jgi:hypothetical protein
MMWLVGAFILAMMFLLMVEEYQSEDEEREAEIDRRIWINYLADRSRKQARRSARSRYGKSGVQ